MEEWKLRTSGGRPDYGTSDLFTIEINSTGQLGHMEYSNGKVDYIDFVDVDKLSMLEIKEMVRTSEVENAMQIFWLMPGADMQNGLKLLENDHDVLEMGSHVPEERVIQLYIKHTNSSCGSPDTAHMVYSVRSSEEEVRVCSGSVRRGRGYTAIGGRQTRDSTCSSHREEPPAAHVNEEDDFDKVLERDDEYASEAELVEKTGWGSEEDDDVFNVETIFPQFRAERDMEMPEMKIGQLFTSFDEFKVACKSHAVTQRRDVRFPTNDKKRVICVCSEDCGFRLYAAKGKDCDTVQIRSGNLEHTCGVDEDLRAAAPSFLVKKYLTRWRVDPSWSIPNLVHTVVTDLSLKINRMKAYRTKQLALKIVHGEDSLQFAKLYAYKKELEARNPGTSVVIEHTGRTFESIYICLGPIKEGFKAGCRRIIGVDGCFLKAMPGWQLLSAVGVDGDDCMYPIAWAIVEKECHDTWEWFMAHLGEDLEIDQSSDWTFMSDRQKGLMNVMNSMYPNAEHRYCVRHMYVNFSGKFSRSKRLKKLFYGAASATYLAEYKAAMEELEKVGEGYKIGDQTPHQWMMERETTQWCKAFYRRACKSDMGVNNHCESFNKYILESRDMPILSCLEDIFRKVMKRIAVRKRQMERLEERRVRICPKPLLKLNKYKGWAAFCFPTFNGNMEYQVQSYRGRYVVDMRNRTCACGRWQLSGIPCQHAISCMKMNKDNLELYMADCYRVEACKRSYSYPIHPLNDSTQWLHDDCIELVSPTFVEKKRGPRQTKRRKEAWELEKTKQNKRGKQYKAMSKSGVEMTCSVCGAKGHNSRFHNGGGSEEPREAAHSPPQRGASPEASSPGAETTAFMPTPACPPITWSRTKVTVSRGRGRGRGRSSQ